MRLVELLQSGRIFNSNHLASNCGVSRRTVFRDIGTLQDAGLVVAYDEERQGYYLPNRLRLPPGELTVDEAMSLLLLCQDLGGAAHGIPFQQAARSAAEKILRTLPKQIRDVVSEATESLAIRLDARNEMPQSESQYQAVLKSLIERRHLRVRYESLSEGKSLNTLLSPYRLMFSRRGWYVIGRSSFHRAVRTFHVGRILEAEIVESKYAIPPRFSLERYLGNAWHLIRDSKHTRAVTVRFDRRVARNVAEVTWHRTQTITWNDDGSIDFHATIDGIDEVAWWILGYGDQAEVLAPADLRLLVQKHLERALERYRP